MGLKRKEMLQAGGLILIGLQFLFMAEVHAQEQSHIRYRNRDNLRQFSRDRAASWELDKKKADSLARVLDLPVSYQERKQRDIELQRLGPRNRPVYYATDNADAARIISTDQVWFGEGGLPFLTGKGVGINLWDGGAVLDTHREFLEGDESRIFMRNRELSLSNHSTHVAGTMVATGVDQDARGMAGEASIHGWDFNNDLAEMAIAASEGMVLSNHSYGPLCGWYYNTTSEEWFWYGDPELSESEDYRFGFYDEQSADVDFIAWNAPHYLIVKSAGNDRNDVPEDQPIQHFVWDGSWVSSILEREKDGGEDGYDCLTPMAVPKNILTVGAVNDNRILASFSASGPTDDGRIKPDVLASGTDVYSSIAASDYSYVEMNGTSMSAASATGSIALLHQWQQDQQPGQALLSSTIKGLLIHSADECGPAPGPDYQHGWGIMNIREAVELMQGNFGNGGCNISEGILNEGETLTIPVVVASATPAVKVTLCWTDPPGEASEPELNPADSKLVNDLNLELFQEGELQGFLPWILDPEHPEVSSTRGVNHVDNVEQVYLANPAPGAYQVKISHSGSLFGGDQAYSLIVSGISAPVDIFPPRFLQHNIGPMNVSLKWTSPESSQPAFYRIYRNHLILTETSDTTHTDLEVVTNENYEYYVTAVYEQEGGEHESLASNAVKATPRALIPLPVEITFEEGSSDMFFKNSPLGWQWGDSESLSSYYLRFQENTTHFMAADSYTFGKIAHINDVAATLPLKLGGCKNAMLSFDYMLVSEIYGAVDELHIMYKLQEENEWQELLQLPRAHSWTHYSTPLPDELCKDGMQIGFYYDDFYLWGMGAGLDNINISGETSRSIDLAITSMISPVSACNLLANEPVSITLLNAGEEDVLPGDAISLRLEVSPGTVMEEQVVLTEALPGGESLIYQMGTLVDLSEPDTYTFSFLLSCDLDHNMLNNSYAGMVESTESPLTRILNQDLLFCEEEEPILIQCSPEGGTLLGPGVSGLYFYPDAAGAGLHTLTYVYTDPSGCQGSASAALEVIAQPVPVILNEDLIFCEGEPAILILVSPEGGTLSGPGVSGLYFDPGAAGAGLHTLSYVYTGPNGCQGAASVEVEVVAQPKPIILNEDLSFCEDEPSVMIQAIPEGGTLSGPGVTGLYLDPQEAGIGSSSIYYNVMYRGECSATTSRDFFVFEKPRVDLGTDRQIELDDTIELMPAGNGVSYLWFDATTENSLVIIGNHFGIGDHPIWVQAFSPEQCSAVDSMWLTVGEISGLPSNENTFQPVVYPNPFRAGFTLDIHAKELIRNVSLLDMTGRIHCDEIPAAYPYFHFPNLPAGTYILRVETGEHLYLFRLVKIPD